MLNNSKQSVTALMKNWLVMLFLKLLKSESIKKIFMKLFITFRGQFIMTLNQGNSSSIRCSLRVSFF